HHVWPSASFFEMLVPGTIVPAMVGGCRSTLFPLIGPAVTHLPSWSHTMCDPVEALASAVLLLTVVCRVNDWSAGLCKPLPASLAVQVIETLAACHCPSALPHCTTGAPVSTFTVIWLVGPMWPTESTAWKVMVVWPSLEMTICAVSPLTVALPGW